MDIPWVLIEKLILSFVVGGAWVTLATIFADRVGSQLGGFFGGLPATAFVALLFIGLVESPQVAGNVAQIIPAAYGINGAFLCVFVLLVRRGLWVAIVAAIGVWLCLAAVLAEWMPTQPFGIFIFWMGSFLIFLVLLNFLKNVSYQSGVKLTYSRRQLVWRMFLSGTIVSSAVLLSRGLGSIFGGLGAVFPGLFISNLVIAYQSRGAEFSQSLCKPLFVSGMIHVVLYAVMVAFLYPTVGLLWGTLISLLVVMASGFLSHRYVLPHLT